MFPFSLPTLPNPYVILAGLVIVVMLCLGSGYEGWHQKSLADNAALVAAQTRVIAKVEQAGVISNEVVGKELVAQQTIQAAAEVIKMEVPVYVTKKSDSVCTVPLGLVLLLNSAASGMPAPGLAAGQSYDDPSGVGLDTVTGIVAGNYGKYLGAQSQVGALVDWVHKQAALAASKMTLWIMLKGMAAAVWFLLHHGLPAS